MSRVDVGNSGRRRLDHEHGCLVGSKCSACATLSWPGRAVCNHCGSTELREVTLVQTGTLLSYTKVWVPREDLPTPYTLGQVRLDDGVTIFAHVRELPEGVRVPMPIRLRLSQAGSPGPVFWFEPL